MGTAKQDPDFYDGLAANLLSDGEDTAYAPRARRYLDLRDRQAVLLRAKKTLAYRAFYTNPLHQSGFRPPLSLADEGTAVRALGRLLERQQVPVAVEKDSKDQHRGTPMAEAQEATGLTVPDVLHWYARLMTAHRRLLSHVAAVTAELAKAERAMTLALIEDDDQITLENAMRACVNFGTSRFMVMLPSHAVVAAWADAEGETVTVGFGGGKSCRIGGSDVPVEWGCGSGIASVRSGDLHRVSGGYDQEDHAMALEFLPGKWRGWNLATSRSTPQTFPYPSGE